MSRDIVIKALSGQKVSRPAVGPLAVHFCARFAGYTLKEFATDAQSLSESVIQYYRRFKPDAVWISADTWVSAEAMGACVFCPGEDQPFCGTGEPLIRVPEDLDRIPPPSLRGRYPILVEATEKVARTLKGEAFIVACFDQYPFSCACSLLGTTQAMLKVVEDRPFLEAVMEKAAQYAQFYGKALWEAGADMLSGGDSPAGLLGPKLYTEVALPFERKVIESLKRTTNLPVSLHICGNTTEILRDMGESGADILELDWQVDPRAALEKIGEGKVFWGNLDTLRLLKEGSTEEIREATKRLCSVWEHRGFSRFVLSSGCTLSVDTPEENLQAMIDTAKSCS